MVTAPAVTVADLTKQFGALTVVDHLTFDVQPGEIFGLVGPDGAGKTTTLRMLAGVLSANGGRAVLAGHDVIANPESARADLSYMSQRFGLYEDLTVDENIRFYADLFGVPSGERTHRAEALLEAAGLRDVGRRLGANLSGGMKQKLGLVCALIHTPRVLLLDEPTNGVDPVSRREFWAILYSLVAEGAAIVISTSYLDEAERCHRVALLHRGRLLFCDRPDALKRRFIGGVLAVRTSAPVRARDALKGASLVRSTLLMGDRLDVFVDDAVPALAQIRARLEEQRVAYDAIEPAEPSIEDLFVSAVGAQPAPEASR